MKSIGTSQIRSYVRNIFRRFQTQAVILMYHRVAYLPVDSYNIAVSPQNFAEQMSYIRKFCHPMRLTDLIEAIQQRSVPPRTVVVTFDDGYVDNYQSALPILEATEVPATVFATTGKIDSYEEFWWDTFERAFLLPTQLPESLQIEVHGHLHSWQLKSPAQRQQAHQEIHNLLRSLKQPEREQFLSHLLQWAKVEPDARPGYRSVQRTELVQLASSELVDIGAHTVNHPALPLLSTEDQYQEIMMSRQKLEELLGHPVVTFSYPFGKHSDDTVNLLKLAGFKAACTTVPARVAPGDDLYRLGRYTVGNWNGDLFSQKLKEFFHEPF
jgi:peptidoglycan/xylan/chitin deacetylase (PgdA/CDA1 family)